MRKKNNLIATQQNFFSHLYNSQDKEIFENIFPYSNQETLARLNIYRNNVFGNFLNVLESIFEVSAKILGDSSHDFFIEYIKSNYSKSGNLDDYGDNFPQFLSQKFSKSKKLDFLLDLAIIELAHYKSFFTKKTSQNFDLENFKKISPPKIFDLKFSLHHSCILFSSKFAIYSIWKSAKKIKGAGQFVLVANASNPIIERLSEIEFLFLTEINQEKNLYQIYQKIYKKIDKKFDIGKILNRFIANHIIDNFYL